MPRKKTDPKLGKLLDDRDAALAAFERGYRRLRAAFGRLDKIRRQLKSLERRIRERRTTLNGELPCA